MLGFVIRENIKHYRRLLETTTDERERTRLHKLLAEERQKEKGLCHSARCDVERTETLEHFPEKWAPVFRRKCDQTNESRAHPGSTEPGCALGAAISGAQEIAHQPPRLLRLFQHRGVAGAADPGELGVADM
jgi:hypothetical protein